MTEVENFENLSTKEKIVKVAADIIVKEGLRKFTAKNVASKLGITDAAIFKHFSSMDEIILTLINEYVIRCSQSAEVGLKKGKDVKEKLEFVLKNHINVLEETKGAVPILCFEFSRSENKKFTEILHSFVQNYKKTLSEIIKQGQEEGIVRKNLNPEETAMFVLGSIQAKVFAKVIERREGPVVPDPDVFIEEIFYGILER